MEIKVAEAHDGGEPDDMSYFRHAGDAAEDEPSGSGVDTVLDLNDR